MNFDLRYLRHVIAVADAANFSRAADAVGISQPGLSRSVAKLEADLGFALFDRTTTAVLPTTMGEPFLREARRLLAQARQLESDARALAAGNGGRLDFGLGPLLGSLILPDLLGAMTRQHPRLTMAPVIAGAEEMMAALADHRIEFCLFTDRPLTLPTGTVSREVGTVTVALLARAGHPLAGRDDLTVADLLPYPLASGSFDGWRAKAGKLPLPEPTIVCDNFHILRDLARGSDTVWLSSGSLAQSGSEGANGLVELRLADIPPSRHRILLARMAQRSASRAGERAEAVIEDLLRRADDASGRWSSNVP